MKLLYNSQFLLYITTSLAKGPFSDKEVVKLTGKEVDIKNLEARFNCPLTKRPWQYRPFGCHNKHDHLKDHTRFDNVKWFNDDSDECKFYDICIRSCKSVNSPTNLCYDAKSDTIQKGLACNCKCSYICIKELSEIYAERNQTARLALLNHENRFITISGDIVDEQFESIIDHEDNDPLFFEEMPKSHQKKVTNGLFETQNMFQARSMLHSQEILDHNRIAAAAIEKATDENKISNNQVEDTKFNWLSTTQINPVINLSEKTEAEFSNSDLPSYEETTECTTWPENTPNHIINTHPNAKTLNYVPDKEDLDFCFQNNWCSGNEFPCKNYICSRRCRECYSRCYGFTTFYKGNTLNCSCRKGIQILLEEEKYSGDENSLKYEMLKIAQETCPKPSSILIDANSVKEKCPYPTNRIGKWMGVNSYVTDSEGWARLIRNMADNEIGTK